MPKSTQTNTNPETNSKEASTRKKSTMKGSTAKTNSTKQSREGKLTATILPEIAHSARWTGKFVTVMYFLLFGPIELSLLGLLRAILRVTRVAHLLMMILDYLTKPLATAEGFVRGITAMLCRKASRTVSAKTAAVSGSVKALLSRLWTSARLWFKNLF